MTHACQGRSSFSAGGAAGFTLFELLVCLSVLLILLTLAVPAFDAVLTGEKLVTTANSYLLSLHLARSEAIKRNARVVVCKSSDGAGCTSTGRWEQGWIIFHDIDNNAQLDPGEDLILRQQALPADLVMWGNAPVSKYVSYAPTGSALLVSGAFQAGTLTLCRASASGGETRNIVINAVGRPRVQNATVASCP